MDTGLLTYLCDIESISDLEKSKKFQMFYETYGVSEIIKSFYNNYKNTSCIYYDEHGANKFNLVVEGFNFIRPIEIEEL